MSYRALFVADVHLSNSLPFAARDPETLITDRFTDVLEVLTQVCAYGDNCGVDDVWIVGDLLDRRLIDAVTLKLVTDALGGKEGIARHMKVRVVPGNHEAHDGECRHYTVDAFSALGVHVVGGSGEWLEPTPGFRVFALPYLPPARANQVIDDLGSAPDKIDLLLVHQTIRGACVGGWTSPEGLDPDVLSKLGAHTIAGHFHSPQKIRANVDYLGAPLQHSFSDVDDDRGFWDITFNEDGSRDAQKVPIEGAPRFHELLWRTSGEPPDTSGISARDYVNLRIAGSRAEVDKLWRTAEQFANKLDKDVGTRLVKLTPVADVEPTRQRIVLGDGERPSWGQIVSRYLDVADCLGLDRQRLTDLAEELIQDGEA